MWVVILVLVVLVIGKNKVNCYSNQLNLGQVYKFGVEFDNNSYSNQLKLGQCRVKLDKNKEAGAELGQAQAD